MKLVDFLHLDCRALRRGGSTPSKGTKYNGDMAELADALGLGPSAARRGGSTPSIPTKMIGN